MTLSLQLEGQQFGFLTVIKRVVNAKRNASCWLVRCDCGREKTVIGKNLKNGNTKSCGCHTEMKGNYTRSVTPEQAARNRYMARYRDGAKRRGYTWALTPEEFESLIDKPCHYCGTPPVLRVIKYRGNRNRKLMNEFLLVNGVDRADNSLGYLPGNVVPCCKFCCYAKRDWALQDFLDYLDRVVAHRTQGV